MKKNKVIIAVAFIFAMLSNAVFSQVYKCTSNGKVIYQSEVCKKTGIKTVGKQTKGFEFDGWKAGMSISEMKNRARRDQLNMSPGTSTIIQNYNEKIINSQPEQRNYAYRTTFMGKLTGVTLYFTKNTKKLYKVKIIFYVVQLKQEERKYFYESLYSQLSEKYGKAVLITKKSSSIPGAVVNLVLPDIVNSKLQKWAQDTDNLITLSYKKNYHTMSSYELAYINTPLAETNTREITNSLKHKTKESLLKDGGRL